MTHDRGKIEIGQNRVWRDTVWDTKEFIVLQRIESNPGFIQYKVVQNGRFEVVSADLVHRCSEIVSD